MKTNGEKGTQVDEQQLNLLCAIQRLEQIDKEHPADYQHWLWDRVISCDVRRLREMLTPETLAWEYANDV